MQTVTNKESTLKKLGLNSNSGSAAVVHEKAADVSRDFRNFVTDVEGLVKATAHLSGEELENAKAKLSERIIQAKKSAEVFSETMTERASRTAKVANDYVHEKPWPLIGASAAIGFLAGYLLVGRK